VATPDLTSFFRCRVVSQRCHDAVTVTDRLGRLLLVTVEAARIGAVLVRFVAFG